VQNGGSVRAQIGQFWQLSGGAGECYGNSGKLRVIRPGQRVVGTERAMAGAVRAEFRLRPAKVPEIQQRAGEVEASPDAALVESCLI
jgi:hypothetical protein